MTTTETVTNTVAETEALGQKLAEALSDRDVVYLEGELGAGKTAFARGLARGLGASERDVASPTFALLHEYAGAGGAIVLRHLDLYRLGDSLRELEVLGLPSSMDGAPVCIEWPRAGVSAVLPATIVIRIVSEPGCAGARRVSIARKPGGP